MSPNGTVALECKVIGVPTPKLVWYKDDKELRSGDSYELRAENNTPTTTYKVDRQNRIDIRKCSWGKETFCRLGS